MPSIAEWLEDGLDAEQALVGNQNGDAKAAPRQRREESRGSLLYPYQNHATMEPMNATALYTADRCEVWTGTQDGEVAFAAVMRHPACRPKMRGPQGHARRRLRPSWSCHDYIRQAVAIAKQMPGTPVKLLWSREEDMTHGRYHPVTQCKLAGAFDADDNLTGLHMRISGQSIFASIRPRVLQNGTDPFMFQGLRRRALARYRPRSVTPYQIC